MENKKLGRWYSVHANCSQFCVYIFELFQKIGSKIYQINKKKQEMKKFRKLNINYYDVISQILQFSLKFVWRHR